MKMGTPTGERGLYEIPGGFAVMCKMTCDGVTKWKRKKLVGASRAQALLVLSQLRRDAAHEASSIARHEDPRKTLNALGRRWVADLRHRFDRGEIRAGTAVTHIGNLERFVLPFLGKNDVDAVTPKMIRDWVKLVPDLRLPPERKGRAGSSYAQAERTYASATLHGAWRTLRAFMSWMTIDADLPRNPAREVRWRSAGRAAKDRTTLTAPEVLKLLDAARLDDDASVHVMIMVALVGALRVSELSALTWDDVDLASGTIVVRRSHVAGSVGEPKTIGSRRTLFFPPAVVDELREHQARQRERRPRELPLMFATVTGKRHRVDSVNTVLVRCGERARLPKRITSHVLRRTTNNLLRQTAGELVARKVTGHVTSEMTAHYSHVDRDEVRGALHLAFGGALDRVHTDSTTAKEER